MKNTKKESGNNIKNRLKGKSEYRQTTPVVNKIEDVKRLVELLQIHQVELEHQNEELRIAQEELEESRNKYVNLFDFAPIPYFTLTHDSVIKEVNLNAAKMMGIDRSKLIGRYFNTFVTLEDKDTFNSFIKNVFDSPVKHSCELKVINKEEQVFKVLLEGLELVHIFEPEQKCQIALIDLTEHEKIEDSLKKSNEELKILNATKDKFFSIIGHDLRSPFHSLLGFSEVLLTEIDTLSHEEVIQFTKGLNDDLKNLYGLLENLLSWSMLQRDLLEYHPASLDLADAVNKVMGIVKQSAREKDISITNNIKTGTLVFADIDMLRLVVQNLLINSVKFTQTGGLVTISSIEEDGFIEISVMDTGIGIEPEKSSQLFNFTSIFTNKGTAGEKGTGLGLPLCKEFVEKNGGKIWVESEVGKGSKFKFTLRKATS
jgi:PAS domain S-box-containing protein